MKQDYFLLDKLDDLGVILSDGRPVSYKLFKNRASIHSYGEDGKIVFLGIPNKNLFGFYIDNGVDSDVMKTAYGMFVDFVKGDGTLFTDKYLQWTDGGIPTEFVNL
jgi:hypothetical protein